MDFLNRDFSIQTICNIVVDAGVWMRRLLAMFAYTITCVFYRELLEGMYDSPGIWFWLGVQLAYMTTTASIIVNTGVNTRKELISWFFLLLYLGFLLVFMA